jgi:alpha-aminoadipate carrier protein LysW
MANCPECGSEVQVAETVMANEILNCASCNVELEVITTDPLKIDLAPEEEEDWGE